MIKNPNITGFIGTVNNTTGLTKVIRTGQNTSFSDVLKLQLERESGITFSTHAMDRIQARGIQLGTDELNRLSQAISKAKDKGATDSLILLDDMAFIVSIKNKTVITAMSGEAVKENVYTNIDSAIVT
ncbi:MAG: flagellar biosynthesis protein [Candidatus Latescibacteria bacterium]|nr:flagellar biosynthesis protein [Candidatus Latescibacterota bacterium]